MKNYIKSDTYYTLYAYCVDGNRVKIGTYTSLTRAKIDAREYENWQIEVTYYLTNLPL